MDSIGVSEIYIYKSTDNKHFSFLRCFTYEDFPAMMDYNTDIYYKTPIAFQGIAGSYYYANVYVYAEKDGSSSTRVYKTTSVQASN